MSTFPASEIELDERLTRPTDDLIQWATSLRDDVLILGAGGKMGPSLAVLAQRAIRAAGNDRRVICASRFSDVRTTQYLEGNGITLKRGDLLDDDFVTSLSQVENVIFLAGMKFGSTSSPSKTWEMNVLLPANISKSFCDSRIVVLSTGNVYPFVDPEGGGATEDSQPEPVGEYAWTCLGRERMFEAAAERHGTRSIRIRLNYATDLRYGVLVDIAIKVLNGEEVPLGQGYFNTIWQGDANRFVIRSLDLVSNPSAVLNITGPEMLNVYDTAMQFGELFDKEPLFTGEPNQTALLNSSVRSSALFGPPNVTSDQLMVWTANWLRTGGRLLNKPTHFEVQDGKF